MIGRIGYGNIPMSGYIYGGYSANVSATGAAEDASGADVVKNPGEST